ncbi:hypothetical protein B0H14DRAFT_3433068 [Mycena olivaceomarginata]|nr:hypothetical protein B0H14DRAFT_3433068 [Mycena olivaceomarginata]
MPHIIKAAARDIKAYLTSIGSSALVGYADIDGTTIRMVRCRIPDTYDGINTESAEYNVVAYLGGYAAAQALLVPLYGGGEYADVVGWSPTRAGAAGPRRVEKQDATRGAEYMRRVISNIARSLVFPLLRGAKQRPDVLAQCGCRFLFGAEQRRAHTLRGMGTVQRCGCRSPFRFAAGQWYPTSHAARGGDHESVGSGSEKTLGCAVEDQMHWSVLSPSGSSARAGASSTPIPGCERICRPHVLGFFSLFAFLCGPTYLKETRKGRDAGVSARIIDASQDEMEKVPRLHRHYTY